MVVVVVLGFYVPPTAKAIRRRDLGLKSHPKDRRSPGSNSRRGWLNHYTTEASRFNGNIGSHNFLMWIATTLTGLDVYEPVMSLL